MKNSRPRTLRLSAEAQILLATPDSALLVVNDGCVVRERGGAQSRLEAGTLLVRERAAKVFDARVVRAIEIMRQRLGERLEVSKLARAVGLSRAVFARRFVAATGFSPHRFLNTLRIEHAARLLIETDSSLAEVAARVGYASEFAFSRAFKRERGIAPSIYRRGTANSVCTMMRAA
ncbi:MAG: helix-turn-helix domain-containing protein [Myxococcota bacterium]